MFNNESGGDSSADEASTSDNYTSDDSGGERDYHGGNRDSSDEEMDSDAESDIDIHPLYNEQPVFQTSAEAWRILLRHLRDDVHTMLMDYTATLSASKFGVFWKQEIESRNTPYTPHINRLSMIRMEFECFFPLPYTSDMNQTPINTPLDEHTLYRYRTDVWDRLVRMKHTLEDKIHTLDQFVVIARNTTWENQEDIGNPMFLRFFNRIKVSYEEGYVHVNPRPSRQYFSTVEEYTPIFIANEFSMMSAIDYLLVIMDNKYQPENID